MSNRVEELESKVAELQATVNGLTEELVETKERLRELEDSTNVEVSVPRSLQGGDDVEGGAGTGPEAEAEAEVEAGADADPDPASDQGTHAEVVEDGAGDPDDAEADDGEEAKPDEAEDGDETGSIEDSDIIVA